MGYKFLLIIALFSKTIFSQIFGYNLPNKFYSLETGSKVTSNFFFEYDTTFSQHFRVAKKNWSLEGNSFANEHTLDLQYNHSNWTHHLQFRFQNTTSKLRIQEFFESYSYHQNDLLETALGYSIKRELSDLPLYAQIDVNFTLPFGENEDLYKNDTYYSIYRARSYEKAYGWNSFIHLGYQKYASNNFKKFDIGVGVFHYQLQTPYSEELLASEKQKIYLDREYSDGYVINSHFISITPNWTFALSADYLGIETHFLDLIWDTTQWDESNISIFHPRLSFNSQFHYRLHFNSHLFLQAGLIFDYFFADSRSGWLMQYKSESPTTLGVKLKPLANRLLTLEVGNIWNIAENRWIARLSWGLPLQSSPQLFIPNSAN